MSQIAAEDIGKRSKLEKHRQLLVSIKQNKECYLMIAPFMLFFIIFTVVPVIMSLPMGFTDFNMAQAPKFVGLSNYTTLFLSDKIFIRSISCFSFRQHILSISVPRAKNALRWQFFVLTI